MSGYRYAFTALLFITLQANAEQSSPALTAQEVKLLQTAETEGLAMYRHDRAASVATDALLELPSFKKDKRLAGWVTEAREHSTAVTFIGGMTDQPKQALCRVTVSDDGSVIGPIVELESPTPLTEFETLAAPLGSQRLPPGSSHARLRAIRRYSLS